MRPLSVMLSTKKVCMDSTTARDFPAYTKKAKNRIHVS